MGNTYTWHEQANTLASRDYKQPQAVVCFRDDITIKIDGGGRAFTLGARDFKGVQCVSYQRVTGTVNAGAHPGSYNGQDAYNDMLVIDEVQNVVMRWGG